MTTSNEKKSKIRLFNLFNHYHYQNVQQPPSMQYANLSLDILGLIQNKQTKKQTC